MAADGASAGHLVRARAKVNLSLHVTGRRADGYHELDGLVVFPDVHDALTFEEADEDRLSLHGPMAAGLEGHDNLVLRALRAARDEAARRAIVIPPYHVRLEKRLPVAAGLGGGSADAAAVLRWLGARHPGLDAQLSSVAKGLGADVPMCVESRPAHIAGIGDIVTPLARMPELALVLVNPGEAVSTPAVFARPRPAPAPAPPLPAGGFDSLRDLLDHLCAGRNDLQPAACEIAPSILSVVEALEATQAAFVRMSGSGASVFAIYDDMAQARAATAAIMATAPRWWVAAGTSPATENPS